MSGPRRLVSVRRRVSPAAREPYDFAWSEVARLARERGAHAWRFRQTGSDAEFLEFLEFAPGADPRGADEMALALRRLAALGNGEAEEWEES